MTACACALFEANLSLARAYVTLDNAGARSAPPARKKRSCAWCAQALLCNATLLGKNVAITFMSVRSLWKECDF